MAYDTKIQDEADSPPHLSNSDDYDAADDDTDDDAADNDAADDNTDVDTDNDADDNADNDDAMQTTDNNADNNAVTQMTGGVADNNKDAATDIDGMVQANVGHKVTLITLSKGYFCTNFYIQWSRDVTSQSTTTQTTNKHHHHGDGAACPSSGVDLFTRLLSKDFV